MIEIPFNGTMILITLIWCLVRGIIASKNRKIYWKREAQLLLVYVCILVIVRITFFPFAKIDGKVAPLIFESAKAFPFRINWKPFVNLFDYEVRSAVLVNIIGNTLMFVPVGIVWPSVFKKLNNPLKVIGAGIGFSLCIEIVQLPFEVRVSDVDDLILNSVGYIIGYLIYLFAKNVKRKNKK